MLGAAGRVRAQSPTEAGTGAALPPAPSDETADVLHGISIPDPFRPLENSQRADVKAWIAAQDERARAYLGASPTRAKARKFLDAAARLSEDEHPGRNTARAIFRSSTTGCPTSAATACRTISPARAAR